MEIREFFIIAFSDPQPLGTQSPDAAEHFTFLGYLRSDPRVDHKFTIAEHVERIALRRLELPGKKVKRLGRYMVTMLADPTEELASAKDELFAALIADGYRCSRPNFYSGDYKPHVSMGPATTPAGRQAHYRKLENFNLNNLSVTESRFDLDYNFLGSEIVATRSF
jgi:hypothetical protein